MKPVWIAANNITSPLGLTSVENYGAIREAKTGIRHISSTELFNQSFWASGFSDQQWATVTIPGFTTFESICIHSVQDALQQISLDNFDKVLFVLATTKGNIHNLSNKEDPASRVPLSETAFAIFNHVANEKKWIQPPHVVSNACASGVTALLHAFRLLTAGVYDHAIVLGADILSAFVVSGFHCLNAISPEPCKPFDKDRKGVSLGEAAATIILTTKPEEINAVPVMTMAGGATSNDANHISGPSRTGEELSMAIYTAMERSNVSRNDIGFVSAHGTATVYNDEMEAKAFAQEGLAEVPVNSLKGYLGHTLGAAGLVESVLSLHSLAQNEIISTLGFESMGVNPAINVCRTIQQKEMYSFLKTSSGFGGCNGAIVFKKGSK